MALSSAQPQAILGGPNEVSDGCWMTLSRSVVNIAIRFGGFNVFLLNCHIDPCKDDENI